MSNAEQQNGHQLHGSEITNVEPCRQTNILNEETNEAENDGMLSENVQQSWITNTANTLESNGVVMQRFSGNESRNLPQLIRKPVAPDDRVNCAYCGTSGEVDEYYAKSNRKEFCSINCLKAATRKMYEIPNPPTKRKEPSPERKLSLPSVSSALKEFKRTLEVQKLSSALTVEVNSKSYSTPSTLTTASDSSSMDRLKVVGKAEFKLSPTGLPNTYDWTSELEATPLFSAAPVSSFRHVPVRGIWENVQPGMKLEVENRDVNHSGVAFWVASVIRIHGYKVLLRFEGYGTDSSRDFWANLCLPEVHPVGWCATQNKPLIPPSALNARNRDWREFLVKRLTGARTIPQNFHEKVNNALKSKYEIGTQLEIVDKTRISRVRLATIVSAMGKRLRLIYFDEDSVEDDFWCHENSSLIHPLGWANAVGQEIYAPDEYNPPNIESKMKSRYSHLQLEEGMKLEAVDPLNLSAICAATIKKVLRYDYIMVRVDCYDEDVDGSDWFCYELTSASIFPCGFCASNGIPLTPPKEYSKESFSWNTYFKETNSKSAPLSSTRQKIIAHGFKEGMRLEAADLMDPRLICVATISHVIGNLMKIHFDGWEEEYDQWLDASSPDIYPIGWSELVKHRLEAPPQAQLLKKPSKVTKKKGKKSSGKRSAPLLIPEPSKEKKRKLLIKNPETGKEGYVKARIPPVVIQMKLNGEGEESSDNEKSPPTTNPGDENGNGDDEPQTENSIEKIIPKLIDSPTSNLADVDPLQWDISDVSQFLRINDCGAYCDSFDRNKIDGVKLLNLTKDQIIVLTGIKVGPAVKILDMISQLKKSARVRKNIFP